MSTVVTAVGLAGLIAGIVVIVRALLWPKGSISVAPTDAGHGGRVFTTIDNQRIDVRFGIVLLVAGCVLTIPHFIGVEYERTTLTILGSLFFIFIAAYSRYATQMRSGRPERYTESLSAEYEMEPRVTSQNLRS